MIDAGIFAKTFRRDSLGSSLDAVAAHGIVAIQFNMALAGGASLPSEITAKPLFDWDPMAPPLPPYPPTHAIPQPD